MSVQSGRLQYQADHGDQEAKAELARLAASETQTGTENTETPTTPVTFDQGARIRTAKHSDTVQAGRELYAERHRRRGGDAA